MPARSSTPRLLVTAGPTREPIDSVRYLSNRSSGRMGLAIAAAGQARGWDTTLLLGPVTADVPPGTDPIRFETTAELASLLEEHWQRHDMLIMAAAVCDHRPATRHDGKLHRDGPQTIELEPTDDLLASLRGMTRPDQIRIGFALEPRDRLEASAIRKLERKQLDAIVANPLETMDGDQVDAILLGADGTRTAPGAMTKEDFASWLLDEAGRRYSPGIVDTMPVQGLDAEA